MQRIKKKEIKICVTPNRKSTKTSGRGFKKKPKQNLDNRGPCIHNAREGIEISGEGGGGGTQEKQACGD